MFKRRGVEHDNRAASLDISPRTVENHRANICTKLDLQGTHALVKFATQHKSELSSTLRR